MTTRRTLMWRALGLSAAPLLAVLGRRAIAQPAEPQVVKLVAQRFHYTPGEIRVKAGQPVVLEFTSLDFVHGFSMPDLHVRADLPPGVVTRMLSVIPAASVAPMEESVVPALE